MSHDSANKPRLNGKLFAFLLAALFFCSGALGLIYEMLWQRRFALLFGSSAAATSAVLAAYFAGLGLGSWLIGSRARSWTRSIALYALLEVGVAIGALGVSAILGGLELIYPRLFSGLASRPAGFLMAKGVLAFIALLMPTFCMGGTLPALARMVGSGSQLSASLLYALNTFGAALGAIAVPFVLLPRLGANGTLFSAVLANMLVALAAWRVSKSFQPPAVPLISHQPRERAGTTTTGGLTLAFVSGLAVFALQVLWNRAFAQVHENSIYSFSIIAAVFILALAAGSALARSCLKRWPATSLIAFAWMAGGVLAAVGPEIFVRLTHGLSYLPSGGDWSGYGLRLTLLAAEILLMPITLIGLGLPLLMDSLRSSKSGDPSSALGKILAVNIAGCVAGALLAGFVLPRMAGLWWSIFLIAALLYLAGAWQLLKQTSQENPRLGAIFIGAVVFWLCSPGHLPLVKLAASQHERAIALSEGAHGIVAVVERPDSRRLKLNNYYVLGGTSSTGDERMQAHIPLLLHPAARKIAFLGLGTGITAGAATFHSLDSITVVELVPEVITAARIHFREANASVLDDVRTRVVLEDARNYLRGTREQFDILINDLVVPWREGEGALFTVEHFAAARKRLAPGGIFCAWLPCFQLSEPELAIIARTFLAVFPQAYVWRGDFSPIAPAIGLIGTVPPFQLDPRTVTARLSTMRPDPANPQLRDPAALWMHWVGVLDSSSVPDTTEINREEWPVIELLGPLRHAGDGRDSNFAGRPLQKWEVGVASKSFPLPLDGPAKAGVAAGAALFEFTLLESEGRQREAQAIQSEIQKILPPRLFDTLFP